MGIDMKNIIKGIAFVAIAIIVETIVAILFRREAPMIVLGVVVFPFYNAMCVRIVIKMLHIKSEFTRSWLALAGVLVQNVEFNVIFGNNNIFEGIRGAYLYSHSVVFIFLSIVCYFISYGVSWWIIKDDEAKQKLGIK